MINYEAQLSSFQTSFLLTRGKRQEIKAVNSDSCRKRVMKRSYFREIDDSVVDFEANASCTDQTIGLRFVLLGCKSLQRPGWYSSDPWMFVDHRSPAVHEGKAWPSLPSGPAFLYYFPTFFKLAKFHPPSVKFSLTNFPLRKLIVSCFSSPSIYKIPSFLLSLFSRDRKKKGNTSIFSFEK